MYFVYLSCMFVFSLGDTQKVLKSLAVLVCCITQHHYNSWTCCPLHHQCLQRTHTASPQMKGKRCIQTRVIKGVQFLFSTGLVKKWSKGQIRLISDEVYFRKCQKLLCKGNKLDLQFARLAGLTVAHTVCSQIVTLLSMQCFSCALHICSSAAEFRFNAWFMHLTVFQMTSAEL